MIDLIVLSFITGISLGIGFAIPTGVTLWILRKQLFTD